MMIPAGSWPRIETMLAGRVSALGTIVYKQRKAVSNENTMVRAIATRAGHPGGTIRGIGTP